MAGAAPIPAVAIALGARSGSPSIPLLFLRVSHNAHLALSTAIPTTVKRVVPRGPANKRTMIPSIAKPDEAAAAVKREVVLMP